MSPGNLMFPGSVWETKKKRNLKKIKNFISKEVALGKFGKPREIFQMINYLLQMNQILLQVVIL